MTGIYRSDKWLSLDPIDRAQVLWVIEGLKPGTTIGNSDPKALEEILSCAKLGYKIFANSVFDIADSQKRLDEWYKELENNQKPYYGYLERHGLKVGQFLWEIDEIHQQEINNLNRIIESKSFEIRGKFYGYPVCCTEEYGRPRTEQEKKDKSEGLPNYTFGREMLNHLNGNLNYPSVFDYLPPSFTPCSTKCDKAIETLSRWKEALDRLDPEAANGLIQFNQKYLIRK